MSAMRSRSSRPTPRRSPAAALDLIAVEYEELPAVTDAIAALQPDAPQVHEERPDGNLLKHIKVSKGDIEAGFAAADVVVDRPTARQRQSTCSLNPSAR